MLERRRGRLMLSELNTESVFANPALQECTEIDLKEQVEKIKVSGDGVALKLNEIQNLSPKQLNAQIESDRPDWYVHTKEICSELESLQEKERLCDEYFADLKEKSEFSDTISQKPFEVTDLNKRTPEENAIMRQTFSDLKANLKAEWANKYGRPWPKYEQEIYSDSGKLIRKAGSDYDAHHIQPLGMGGENTAENITPLNAEVHYDKQGIHSPDSPYSKLAQIVGGVE